MIAKAVARYIRISPRKTRLVADAVRGKKVAEAMALLANINKKACIYIKEVLHSAIANATRNPDIDQGNLYISKLVVDGGPMLKRFRAGSMGRAMMIRHRTSHITVELDTIAKPKPEPKKAAEAKSKRPLLRRRK
jgi:large subunit ribosomal protein L22